MVLRDIMDQFDIENHFEYGFSMYCNFLEREGKWNLCENNTTKNNFKCRMRKQYRGDLDRSREWIKFENFIEKRKVREQKEAEMRAKAIARVCEEKDKEELLRRQWVIKQMEEQIKQLEEERASLKLQIKEEFDKRMLLMDKYDSDSD